MLGAAELTSMRATLTASLPDQAQVRRNTYTPDSQGGRTDAWADHGSPVPCLLSPVQRLADESVHAGSDQLLSIANWLITVPYETDVTVDDRIRVGSREFEIVEVRARSYELGRRLEVREKT